MDVDCCNHIIDCVYNNHLDCFRDKFEFIRHYNNFEIAQYFKPPVAHNPILRNEIELFCCRHAIALSVNGWMSFLIAISAARGYISIVKYLYECGYNGNVYAIGWAAENNHLKCLKFLCVNNCPLPINIVSVVSIRKNLKCLALLNNYHRKFGAITSRRLTDTQPEEVQYAKQVYIITVFIRRYKETFFVCLPKDIKKIIIEYVWHQWPES